MAATQALAEALPFNRGEAERARRRGAPAAARADRRARARPTPRAARSRRRNASPKLGEAGSPCSASTASNGSLDRVRVDSGGPRAHHQPGRRRSPTTRTRSRPGCAARRCSRTSSCARRSRTSTTSAFPSASCTRAARARTATSSATSRSRSSRARRIFAEAGKRTPVFVRFSTVAGRARLDRHRARRARLRREVLHRRGQLGPRRQQHPGVLHPGRDEVPRPGPRGEARAAPRDAAGGVRARHVLGLRVADARIDAHADVGDVRPRDPAQLPHDAGLRRAHVPASSTRDGESQLREVPLEARSRARTRSTGTRP